jgi:plastocyanin
MRLRTFTAAAVVLVLAGASGCGGGGSSSGSPTAPSASTTTPVSIAITTNNGARSFTPNPAAFGGMMVTFRNNDTVVHRVRLNEGALDTGDVAPGATSQPLLMPSAGANYHCALHPSMIGAVSPSTGAPPPPCVGEYC